MSTTPVLSFNSIHIIETLRSNDLRTGQILFDELERIGPQVSCHLSSVRTREEFLNLLSSIAREAHLHGHSPILQIEAHGSSDGIEVTSGEFLPWIEMKAALTTINEISKLNLLVMLAACEGAHLVSLIKTTDRAPVFALIGPKRIVTQSELECATLAFYRTLFRVGDAAVAWRTMNNAITSEETTFSVFIAEYLFRYVYHHYLKTLCSEDALAKREDDAAASYLHDGLPIEKVEHFRQWFRSYVRDHQGHFERMKQHFFFSDLYPENVTRFDVSFEDCFEIGYPEAV